ncbi:MAG TPA: Uma2 family endonuclease [Gemmatimonadaceae bacterium]|nr:Uma2 family endonuclease [Gemmatimonadaceae bacterium]
MAMPASTPSPDQPRKRWTAREVHRLIAESPLSTPRYELVDGALLVTPSPSWRHQRALDVLWREIDRYLSRYPLGRASRSPFDVELEPQSLTQPDLFVVPLHESRRLQREGLPARELLLAVEVLSRWSGRHDRVEKRPVYQRHIPEYWTVDVDARLFERWRPGSDHPELLMETLEWQPTGAAERFRLDLPWYFAEVCEDG